MCWSYNLTRYIFLLFLLVLLASCKKEENERELVYWQENIGTRTDLPFLPDANVNYFGYSFKRKNGDKIGIRIRGQYAYARYMSYNLYNNNTKSSINSIGDVAIVADENNQNPFITHQQTTDRNYTISIVPESAANLVEGNSLTYNDTLSNVGIFLRYYVPEVDKYANVPLPTIEAFDVETGAILPVPTPLSIDFTSFNDFINGYSNIIDLTYLLQAENNIEFFRFSGIGLYQNLDNKYMFAPLLLGPNEVAIIRLIPPSYANTMSAIDTADVRYFSFGLGDSKTYNYVTAADFELKAAEDGYINIVIARKDTAILRKAHGLNFMEWVPELKNRGLIVYRNLLTQPNYEYHFDKVPDLLEHINRVFNTPYLYASTYLGNHAPQGKKMSKQQFLKDFGGVPVSY